MSAALSATAPPASRRRRVWPWVLLGVALLLALAAIAADVLVRGMAEKTIAQQLGSALDVPEGTEIEVQIGGGSVLVQALTGGLDRVDIAARELTIGSLTGDLDIVARGVPLDPAAPTRELAVRFEIPRSALSALTPEITGVSIDDVTIEGSELVVTGGVSFLGATLSLGLGLSPSVVEGDLAFEPTSVRLGETSFTAEQLRGNRLFGGLAEALLQQRRVCIADELPAALTLTGLETEGATLVASLDGAGAAMGSFGTLGVCS